MRTAVWIVLGWMGMTFWTAVAARLAPAHLLPDAAIVVVTFVALRREPIPVAVVALSLGYLAGRQAGAPTGLHEVALVVCAVTVYQISGPLAGEGAVFHALVAGGAATGYHLLTYVLLFLVRGTAGFPGLASALLVPAAMLTALLALISYAPMMWLENRLVPPQREGLAWR